MEKSYLKITILSVCLDIGNVERIYASSVFCGFYALFMGPANHFLKK